jgi:hypothetical protein
MPKRIANETISGSLNATGDISTSGAILVNGASGSEGGQIELAKAPNGSTNGSSVVIDIYDNKLRFFEKDSPNRGAYIDITSTSSSVGTNLLSGTTGAMNYEQQQSTKQSNISASGVTIVSRSFTTNGYPVQVIVTGDAENSTAGAWVKLQLYRDSTPIGKVVHVEMSAGSENVPYALTVIDTPSAGTYVYALKTVSTVAAGTMNFGETDGPVLTMIELAGRIGPTGSQGPAGADGIQLTALSAVSPIVYNNTTGQFSLDNIDGGTP